MIRFHKTSQIATLHPDMTVEAYERELNKEGLTGGYHPVTGSDETLSDCLSRRIPNLFFMKYGGIEELCVGGVALTPKGRHYKIKLAPRASVGPDLRRVLIGSEGSAGRFKEVSLKVFPIPEHRAWGLVFPEHPEKARQIFQKAQGQFIRPLFAGLLSEGQGEFVRKSLELGEKGDLILGVKLAGLKGMVEAEKDVLSRLCDEGRVFCHWSARTADNELLDRELLQAAGQAGFFSAVTPLTGKPSAQEEPSEPQLRKTLSAA